MSQDAVGLCIPELGDVIVKLVHPCLRLFRPRQLDPNRLPFGSFLGVLALDSLPQTLKLALVEGDRDILAENLAHDGLESVLECPAAEVDDLVARYAVILAVVEIVRIFARRKNSMAGGKEEDPIAPAAFT